MIIFFFFFEPRTEEGNTVRIYEHCVDRALLRPPKHYVDRSIASSCFFSYYLYLVILHNSDDRIYLCSAG